MLNENDTRLIEFQHLLFSLCPENYKSTLSQIQQSTFYSQKEGFTQLIHSIKAIYKINDELSDLCTNLLIDMSPNITAFFSMEEIIHLFSFHEYKSIIYQLREHNIITNAFLSEAYIIGSTEYGYFMLPKGDHLKKLAINPDELAIAIRKDNFEDFQTIISNSNLDINMTIDNSQYERFNFINCRPTLLEFSAFFRSIIIFKYLLMNGAKLTPKLPKFATAGGNYEIIHILESRNMSFDGCLDIAIAYFREDLINYFIETKNYQFSISSLVSAIMNYNYEYFFKILQETKNINEITQYAFGTVMSPLHAAAENGYLDIVKILCSLPDIDLNVRVPIFLVLFLFLYDPFAFSC
ncbi:hypothetical protein TRFO_10266 [Tritrichomonas foetus]|uniref:DUF3447 domain-containing protein n=1 Tax=Tritrichomonas foetus TaxID=1144522 RepID=A0A1J4JC85_9EUKA|nr:hypothetical protein TRFO_10266 [Tritrichomonas foetus]|eukprot:OHS95863.1 hypothetical protein TRFO_10266 [Tritrichomonas foetus]